MNDLKNNREKEIPSYNRDRKKLGEVLPLDTPFTVILDTSERCNFRCSYCFRSDKNHMKHPAYNMGKLMEWSVFERAVAQMQEFPGEIKRISLSCHGEPLLNDQLPDMVGLIKERGFKGSVEFHTNASALTHNLSERLVHAGLDKMVVSIQGLSNEKYEEICRANIDFEKLAENIAYLYKIKKDLLLHVKIIDMALGDNEEQSFKGIFENIADSYFIEKSVPIFKNAVYQPSEEHLRINKYGAATGIQPYCQLLFYELIVSPEGDIYPCSNIVPPFTLGNVRDTTLLKAWNSEARERFLREHLANTRMANSICKECNLPNSAVKDERDLITPYVDLIQAKMNYRSKARKDG